MRNTTAKNMKNSRVRYRWRRQVVVLLSVVGHTLLLAPGRVGGYSEFFKYFPDPDGTAGCKSNGYGMTIGSSDDPIQYSCGMQGQRLCEFGEQVIVTGSLSVTRRALPRRVKVVPKICYTAYGMMCSPEMAKDQWGNSMVVPLCDGPLQETDDYDNNNNDNGDNNEEEEEGGGGGYCPGIGNYKFWAVLTPPEDSNQYLAQSTRRMLMRVTFSPLKYNEYVYFARVDSFGEENVQSYQQKQQQQQEQQEEQQDNNDNDNNGNDQEEKAEYSYDQVVKYQTIMQQYLSEPTESIYCHIPFRMVNETFDLDQFYERRETYSWRSYDARNYETYRYRTYQVQVESIGLIALLSVALYKWISRRRRLQEEEEAEASDRHQQNDDDDRVSDSTTTITIETNFVSLDAAAAAPPPPIKAPSPTSTTQDNMSLQQQHQQQLQRQVQV